MKLRAPLLTGILLLLSRTALATSFIVPADDEMIAKSTAIVVGTVQDAHIEQTESMIETVYEIRVQRTLKGDWRGHEIIPVHSPGGIVGDRGVYVPAAPRFDRNERVLLFLTFEGGRWQVTDLALGKFRFGTSDAGEPVLVRDLEEVMIPDSHGQMHREKVRRETFLDYIEERARGRATTSDYELEAFGVMLAPTENGGRFALESNAVFPAPTYTDWVSNMPTRWSNAAGGVTFRKRANQNIAGVADGGVGAIQSGLAAWTNDCGSAINLIYGGTTTTGSADFDGLSVVEFNDPQGRVSGSWGGSGTIAITFMSFSGTHPFAGTTWWSISDADVVFQDGFPGTHAAFPAAMTHELGHGIGWRHSNQNHQTGGACNSAVEECTSAAIMNSSVSSAYGYTLQPWDINAARQVYPGGTCGPVCTAPAVTTQPTSSTMTAGNSVTLNVAASGTAPLAYQWYIGSSGNTANPIAGATGSTLTVTPGSTTSYWVRVVNSCGTVNSATATITVSAPPPVPQNIRNKTDFDGDGRADLFWRHMVDGRNAVWYMNGATTVASVELPYLPLRWIPVAFGDMDNDGRSDIFWHNTVYGFNAVWLSRSRTTVSAENVTTSDTPWTAEVSGDFNGDGRTDVFWRNQNNGQHIVWYMNGNVQTSSPPLGVPPAGYRAVAAGDFDGNGRYDILFRNATTGGNLIWFMTASGPQQMTVSTLSSSWTAQGTGDFNDDGRSDVLWRVQSSGLIQVWLMNTTPYQTTEVPAVPSGWRVGVIGDFNADGTQDIAWRGDNGYNFITFMRDGRLSFQAAMTSLGEQAWQLLGLR